MTRDQKAAERAEGRARRRRPPGEQQSNGDEPQREEEPQQQEEPKREERPRAKREQRRGAGSNKLATVATQARELLRSVRGVEAESISGIERSSNGWTVTLEVVELRRIPESTDILASYEVELDGDGRYLGFSRGRRYHRAQAELENGR